MSSNLSSAVLLAQRVHSNTGILEQSRPGGTADSPAATWVCVPALCFVPGPPKPPDDPRAPHHGTHGLYMHAHMRGEAGPGAAAPGYPAVSRPRMGAAQSPPSSRPRSSAATGQHGPSQSGERGRHLPLTSPGPGRAEPGQADRRSSVGAAEGNGAPRTPTRSFPARRRR